MKKVLLIVAILSAFVVLAPGLATADQQPEMIAEKMAIKFTRGVTNAGVVEAVFCMVPQPGYYDPMMDPEYVWQGWEPKRDTTKTIDEEKKL